MIDPCADYPCCDDDCAECVEKADQRRTLRERAQSARERVQRRRAALRASWDPGVVVAATVTVNKGILADEPRWRNMIDHDLMDRLADSYPLRWRYNDGRWALINLARAVRGAQPIPLPYRADVEIRMTQDGADLFQRDAVVILAECRRVPVLS